MRGFGRARRANHLGLEFISLDEVTEAPASLAGAAGSAAAAAAAAFSAGPSSVSSGGGGGMGGAANGSGPRRGPRQPAVHHTECITAVELIDFFTGPMLLSASRDGVIKVWR